MNRQKFRIYRWYGWGFKHWYLMGEYDTLKQVTEVLLKNRTLTYAVLYEDKVIRKHIGLLRYGMSQPQFNSIPDYK